MSNANSEGVGAYAIWSLRQVDQVEALRCTIFLDDSLVERDGDAVLQEARIRLARKLQHDAQPFGVDLHVEDVDFVATRQDHLPWQAKVTAAWRPKTNAAELHGGPHDGEIFALQKRGQPLLLPTVDATPWLEVSEQVPESALVGGTVRYELSGWSEQGRRWVYSLSPK